MKRRFLERIPFFKRELLAGDIMTKNPVAVDKNLSAQQAAKIMTERRIGTVIVKDKNKPIGIVTDTDLTKRIIVPAKDPKKLKVKDVMTSPLIFSGPTEKIGDVASKMRRHKIKRIPILDNGNVVGIVTTTDIVKSTPEMLDLLEARLLMREGEPTFGEGTTAGICENCGNYSDGLSFDGEKWICEECREGS